MPKQNPRYPKPSTCAGCTLEHAGFGFAYPSGPADARLRFVGEALGWEEAIAGEPFYGAAGGMLSRLCTRAGIDRRHVRIANVINCRPPGDFLVGASYEEHAISMCRQYLQPELDATPDNGVVVPLGATALAAVLNLRGVAGVAVKDFHGCVTRSVDDRYWVVPSFHPAGLLRGNMNLTEVVTQDLQLAQRISTHGFKRSQSQLVVDPHPDWYARWIDDHLVRVAADPEGVHLSIDTEFAEKAGGADESEVVIESGQLSPLTRVNGGNDNLTGWTVPYREPYRSLTKRLLEGVAAHRGWIWMWNKYADLAHLWADGHCVPNEIVVDGMWLWHYLQSDLPRGLGFVAPMASDFGAWKHWGKVKEKEGIYAAADGLQNWRTCMWLLAAATKQGVWEIFLSDWHERDCYVLQPATTMGVPVDRAALEAFHVELQGKLAGVLDRIKTTAAQGVLKPKLGYAKRPKGKACPTCQGPTRICTRCGSPTVDGICQNYGCEGTKTTVSIPPCAACGGSGELPPTPPASILGEPKKGGGEAKSTYMTEGVRLVEREIEVEVRVCLSCGASEVGPRHKCPVPKGAKRRRGSVDASVEVPVERPAPQLTTERRPLRRFFWQLPFNPDAPAQILAYLADRGIAAPEDRKTGKKTTNKKALATLQQQHRDDPFFQLQLDWKAVQKVDSTYAVGTLQRLDKDDRVHPEFLPKPSTFRDSCVNPNLQNCIRAGTLIEIVRDCSQYPKGIPIEHVRPGDLAYAFTADGQLTLKPVTAVIPGGRRALFRVHWRSANKRPAGYVDLTSDHRVRLLDGTWKIVAKLQPGDRLTALARFTESQGYEYLCSTGGPIVREHRFVWEQLYPAQDAPHVHHRNENKRDNRPENLEGIAVGEHFRHHNAGAGNPKWREDLPLDPYTRRRVIEQQSRAAKRAADPEGFKKHQRDSKRAWYQANRAKRPKQLNNHRVLCVEPLMDDDWVYDLTIRDVHNFIAGEICVHNCVADKAGPDGLASGFRRCVVARDGVPPGVTEAELAAWSDTWT